MSGVVELILAWLAYIVDCFVHAGSSGLLLGVLYLIAAITASLHRNTVVVRDRTRHVDLDLWELVVPVAPLTDIQQRH